MARGDHAVRALAYGVFKCCPFPPSRGLTLPIVPFRRYEFAYGVFKYCEKKNRKISMHDSAKAARDMRQEAIDTGEEPKDDAFTKFWLQVDELLCSCVVMIAVCKMSLKTPLLEDALAACNEAIELRPHHSPAYYRRSQVHHTHRLIAC